jgi:hypothetical protein
LLRLIRPMIVFRFDSSSHDPHFDCFCEFA